jgi:hypothetical protein
MPEKSNTQDQRAYMLDRLRVLIGDQQITIMSLQDQLQARNNALMKLAADHEQKLKALQEAHEKEKKDMQIYTDNCGTNVERIR